MKNCYNYSAQDVIKELNTNLNGISDKDKDKIREKYGYNELQTGKKAGVIKIFLGQFKDFLVIILLTAAVISLFLRDYESAIVIFAVTILNSILGTAQHFKAEKSLESLKSLSSPVARVIRNKMRIEIPSREVLPGDILLLEAGDFISADGRIIENHSLQVNESSLTGESESVIKTTDIISATDVPIGDRKNMVFTGSHVTYGRAVIAVTNTAMSTELGKIASLMDAAENKQTPLQVSLDKFGKKLAVAILILCGIILATNIIRGYTVIDSFMFAIALAVAAIPEALSSIVTIVLAIGTQKMAKENAIVRKLHAVESLGSVSVICSDKTGTLTQNKMVAKKVFAGWKIFDSEKLDMEDTLQRSIVKISILSSDATITDGTAVGDPTEVAFIKLANDYGYEEEDVRDEYARLSEVPFDSDRKLMSTMHNIDGQFMMFTKGAPDVILSRSKNVLTEHGDKPLEQENIEFIEKVNREFSQDGLRVLAFARKTFDSQVSLSTDDEKDLTFVGLVAMIDPPREESRQAVADCIRAGIKPVMITGDHKITASAIAKQIGIMDEKSHAVEGADIEKMSEEELKSKVQDISVYARVSPEHKIRIVKAWQDKGNVVSMTGDGVNDAPALKQADIGVAMGKVGTEVAKDAASMILVDDNFATIVKAVSNGRSIYTNIKNSIKFLLSGNTAGILAVLYTSILALPLPFTAMHLLFINLLTDSMPAIALGLEPYRKDVLNSKPRDINQPLLNRSFLLQVIFEGAVIAASALAAFYYGLNVGGATLASTMAFAVLALARLIHGFNCRSKYPLFKIGIFTNKFQWGAVLIGIALLALVLTVPPLQHLFEINPQVGNHLGIIGLLSLVPFVVIQLYKIIRTSIAK
ncbi:MAG: P-type ATPase, translocating [Eubacterium sp.]|jgi:Ca2+-transporting ATPase|nr:P-type ATPase, translocating [Eubacterium sp.]